MSGTDQETAVLLEFATELNLTSQDLYDLVHDLKSKEASAINNNGLQEQLSYLAGALGHRQVETELRDLAP